VEGGRLDELVYLLGLQLREVLGRRGVLEESKGRGQAHLVPRADRDDAADELMKDGPISTFRQLEHRRPWELAHGPPDGDQGGADVEGHLGGGFARSRS